MTHLVIWLSVLAIGAQPPDLVDQRDVPNSSGIAPFLGREASALVRIDLTRLPPDSIQKHLPQFLAHDETAEAIVELLGFWINVSRTAGARELFVLVNPNEFTNVPLIVVPGLSPSQQKAIMPLLTHKKPSNPPKYPSVEVIRNELVAGSPSALKRLREVATIDRPDLLAPLATSGQPAIQVVIAPSPTLRRAIEESVGRLPSQLGGGSITTFTQDLDWASISLTLDTKPMLQLVSQSTRPGGIQRLGTVLNAVIQHGKETHTEAPNSAHFQQALALITHRIEKDRLILEMPLEHPMMIFAVPARKIQAARHRVQCVNNLKMLGLAMHNYASNHQGAFPPAYTTSPDGKPLLSWRVLILPYLEEKSLYEQFKLNEPWDSPHNKMLVSRIPKFYVCPACSPKLKQEGRTTYVVPRGDATIFPGSKSVSLKEITDGTSNTILTLELSKPKGVVWTQPEDWDAERDKSSKPMFGTHAGGTNAGLADGSVRFLRDTVSDATFKKLFTRNGGEVIGPDEY